MKAHKVIVAGKSFSTSDPYRLNVGYDDVGISLREMFFSVIPNSEWPPWSHMSEWQRMSVVLACLGSGFGACWVDENEPTRNISINTLKRFPLPAKTSALDLLASAGQDMAEAVLLGDRDTLISVSSQLERAIATAYELPQQAQLLIQDRLAGMPDRVGVVRYRRQDSPLDGSGEQVNTRTPSFGHVLSATEDGLRIWIAGITDIAGVDVSAPLQMPGWLCRPGADFVISGAVDAPRRAHYGFHREDWLTDEQLTSRADAGY